MILGQPLVDRHGGHDIGSADVVYFAAGAGGFGGVAAKPRARSVGWMKVSEAIVEWLIDSIEAAQFFVGEILRHNPGETED